MTNIVENFRRNQEIKREISRKIPHWGWAILAALLWAGLVFSDQTAFDWKVPLAIKIIMPILVGVIVYLVFMGRKVGKQNFPILLVEKAADYPTIKGTSMMLTYDEVKLIEDHRRTKGNNLWNTVMAEKADKNETLLAKDVDKKPKVYTPTDRDFNVGAAK